MQISKSLSSLAVLAAGVACGAAYAAQPVTTPTIAFGTAHPSVQAGKTYYRERIPGTDKVRKVYLFDRIDADHDGRLSRAEIPHDMHALRAYFLEVDSNQDKQLTPSEYRWFAMERANVIPAISSWR